MADLEQAWHAGQEPAHGSSRSSLSRRITRCLVVTPNPEYLELSKKKWIDEGSTRPRRGNRDPVLRSNQAKTGVAELMAPLLAAGVYRSGDSADSADRAATRRWRRGHPAEPCLASPLLHGAPVIPVQNPGPDRRKPDARPRRGRHAVRHQRALVGPEGIGVVRNVPVTPSRTQHHPNVAPPFEYSGSAALTEARRPAAAGRHRADESSPRSRSRIAAVRRGCCSRRRAVGPRQRGYSNFASWGNGTVQPGCADRGRGRVRPTPLGSRSSAGFQLSLTLKLSGPARAGRAAPARHLRATQVGSPILISPRRQPKATLKVRQPHSDHQQTLVLL